MTRNRVRGRLSWSPSWEGPVQGWAVNFIKANKWRCDWVHDKDDLLQDAYLTYLKVVETYPRVIEPKHFMALFKAAMWNAMHDRARYKRRKRLVHEETPKDVSEFCEGRIGELTNYGYINVLLAEAPEELHMALALLEENPEALRSRVNAQGQRENLNMKLRRILGLGNVDVIGTLRSLLSQG
jgi:hypothetical protein